MRLKYLKADKMLELETNIETNIKAYASGTKLINRNDFLESNISYKELKLFTKEKNNKNDFEDVKKVYGALKHLTPLEASDGRIWAAMTHEEEGMKYTINRWNISEETTIRKIKERFFDNSTRNAFARLWWIGYVSYNDTLEDHYTLTKLLVKNSEAVQGLMERSYSRNKDFMQNFLFALHEWVEINNNPFPKTDNFKKITKEINRISAINLVDLIEINDFKNVLKKYC